MIILIDDYSIKTDSLNWIVCKKSVRINKDTGEKEDIYTNVAYCSTFEYALDSAYQMILRDRVSARELMTLSEAIETAKAIRNEIKKLAEVE